MSSGSGVCECWRLTPEGFHGSRACPFYGMHWSEVVAITNREVGSRDE